MNDRVAFEYQAGDDFGVRALKLRAVPVDPPPGLKGAPPQDYEIEAPATDPKTAGGHQELDLSEHPYAGMRVMVRIVAVDAMGQEGVERAFDRGMAVGRAVIFVERAHAPLHRHHRPPGRDRVKQLRLVLEIVIEQRVMNADTLGHVLQRHAVQTALREQEFGGVQNLLHRLGALFRLGWPLCSGLRLGRQNSLSFRIALPRT